MKQGRIYQGIILLLATIWLWCIPTYAKETYPTTIFISNGGYFCSTEAIPNINVTMTNPGQIAECGSGSNTFIQYTVTLYSNTTESSNGGTVVSSSVSNSYPSNGSSLNLISYIVPGTCQKLYYYAVISWTSMGCAGNGSYTTGVIELGVLCNCVSPSSNQSYSSCPLSWFDSGGGLNSYSNNENYTVTFCPDTPGKIVKVDFHEFLTDEISSVCYDPLKIYMGASVSGSPYDSPCGSTAPFSVVSTSPDGCITFQFTSGATVTQKGWAASISCVSTCSNPSAKFNQTPVNICPTTSINPGSTIVNFDAASSNSSSGWSISQYEWDFGDGTKTSTTSSSIAHAYESEGIYVAKLTVRDNNTGIYPEGCPSTNAMVKVIQVLPQPASNFATPEYANCGGCLTVAAMESSQTIVQQLPTVETGTVLLPDGVGNEYISTADYTGYFPPGATVNAGCYPKICFSLEHSYSGDLEIYLVAPNGTEVKLYNKHGANTNFGTCANGSDNQVPGCPQEYCVVGDGSGVSWTGGLGVAYQISPLSMGNCSYSGICETSYNYISRTFNSYESFTSLNGVPLNGTWSIKIRDNLSADDGFLSAWSMSFPSSCYGNIAWATPDVTDIAWLPNSDGGPAIPLEDESSSVIYDPGPPPCPPGEPCDGTSVLNSIDLCTFSLIEGAEHQYNYRVSDEFGCQWERGLIVNVICPLPAKDLTFNGKYEGDHNGLYWNTLTERNTDCFLLQRSIDGKTWKTINKQNAQGNSEVPTDYAFQDHDFTPGLTNYYRLHLHDKDGFVEESDIIPIQVSQIDNNVLAIPNPAHNFVNIHFNSDFSEAVEISLIDYSGKLILVQNYTTKIGDNSAFIDLREIEQGDYLIKITDSNSTKTVRLTKL